MSFIQKDRQCESLVEKLCHRFRATRLVLIFDRHEFVQLTMYVDYWNFLHCPNRQYLVCGASL